MGRWRSGQTHLTVNQAALCLRGFESLPAHRVKLGLAKTRLRGSRV